MNAPCPAWFGPDTVTNIELSDDQLTADGGALRPSIKANMVSSVHDGQTKVPEFLHELPGATALPAGIWYYTGNFRPTLWVRRYHRDDLTLGDQLRAATLPVQSSALSLTPWRAAASATSARTPAP